MTRVERIGDAVLYLGDCREVLPMLPRVDAVVTSLPYAEQRTYGLVDFNWQQTVCAALSIIGSPNAQILVNLGLVHENGRVYRYWDALIDDMDAKGWRLFGWYIWDQLSGMTGDWNGRLAPSFEFVFHFNRIARPVNKTEPTISIGRCHSGGIRQADGSIKLKSHDGRAVQPTKIPDNVIRTVRETSSSGPDVLHPARFPVAFAKKLIAPFTDPGDMVLDPFMGSGTTGVACVKLGRKFTGIEIEPRYFDIACRRIEDAHKQKDLFIHKPEPRREIALALPL